MTADYGTVRVTELAARLVELAYELEAYPARSYGVAIALRDLARALAPNDGNDG